MSGLRMVLDSNVIISGFLFGGHPARLLKYALNNSVHCFTSLPILDEVREVLLRPKFKLNAERVFKMIEELHALCEVVTPTRSISVVVNDPDDDIILECAFAARAEIIVSGDSHLLDLEFWEGIPIITPADAIKQIDHN